MNVWNLTTPKFEEHYQVVLFDYVGSGKSDYQAYSADKYNDLYGYAQDVLDVCTALELKEVIFVGHSVGGIIGMLAAIQKPELFEQLILIGPSPFYLNDIPDYRDDVQKVTVPSLILQCSDDSIAPIAVGEYMHRHLQNSTLQIMDATGHCPHMSHPEETVQLISDSLDAIYKSTVENG